MKLDLWIDIVCLASFILHYIADNNRYANMLYFIHFLRFYQIRNIIIKLRDKFYLE
jgi:hypothetical protein